ncbi:hypothetical protein EJ02DRAFT_455262 [Clathrospora elynae]|uniref:Uncharacterized protein n=1 Tax=Clathrospora elynae TaxID=706981 RepID=A0A6A5SL03_9PLEO|nr:hypothetical protein EJ02DRAFT_455262 [Clathrospora elynae]
MTFNDDRRRPAGGRDGGRGPAARPRPQQSGPIRRLQDRITHDDNANSEVSNEPPTCIAANNNSVDMIASSGLKLNPSQQFTMLLGSTQVEQYCPLLPVPPPGRRPVFSAQPIRMFNRPLDTPDDDNDDDELKCAPARPINTYRGKNEIKLMVQNPNLRAIFAGKPYPKERKKASGEKPVLRMGMSRELK